MSAPRIILLQPSGRSDVSTIIADSFDAEIVADIDACLDAVQTKDFKVLILDLLGEESADLEPYETLFSKYDFELPIILLWPNSQLHYTLQAFEMGFDDVLSKEIGEKEMVARISKSIYNSVANEQLKSRLQSANETAYSAMAENSDLGANLHFLLEENHCDNLDELGQLLFMTIERYGLSCSLQIRSLYGTKNMEANGMAKDLESQLLEQLANAGRFVDFGRRTVVNYGQASLLIRNMPLNDQCRYGRIKDNVLALLQGVDARVKALDASNKLKDERNALHKLSTDIRSVMEEIDLSYQQVMRDIATAVEDMAEAIQSRIPILALSEEQERFFDDVVTRCVVDTNRIFNHGLKVDEVFHNLCDNMDQALIQVSYETPTVTAPPRQDQDQGKDVELF